MEGLRLHPGVEVFVHPCAAYFNVDGRLLRISGPGWPERLRALDQGFDPDKHPGDSGCGTEVELLSKRNLLVRGGNVSHKPQCAGVEVFLTESFERFSSGVLTEHAWSRGSSCVIVKLGVEQAIVTPVLRSNGAISIPEILHRYEALDNLRGVLKTLKYYERKMPCWGDLDVDLQGMLAEVVSMCISAGSQESFTRVFYRSGVVQQHVLWRKSSVKSNAPVASTRAADGLRAVMSANPGIEDELFGIVQRESPHEGIARPFDISVRAAKYADPTAGLLSSVAVAQDGRFTRSASRGRFTYGADESPDEAAALAFLEALERYFSTFSPCRGRGLFATLRELSKAGSLTLADIPGYEHTGERNAELWLAQVEVPGYWLDGYSLKKGHRRVLVPAADCFDRYSLGDNPISLFTSNGCAAGFDAHDALARGLLEVAERDAVTIWWYRRARRPNLNGAAVAGALLSKAEGWLADRGGRLKLLDLTNDLRVPVVAAIAEFDGMTPQLGFGAGFTLEAAARKALLELAQVLAFAHPQKDAGGDWGEQVQLNPSESRDRVDAHAPGVASLEELIGRMALAGIEPVAVDLFGGEQCGFYVGKVFCPGAAFGHQTRLTLRVKAVPEKLGWTTEPTLNPKPLEL